MDFGNNQIAWYADARLITAPELATFGTTLIIAPHQDDESLGCGGTIALLRQARVPVKVIYTTDGSLSHPNSKKYPKEKLTALREQEALTALHLLGVNANDIIFMGLPDGSLPLPDQPGFEEAVAGMSALLEDINPQTLLLPWQRDPHPDHRATWHIVNTAIKNNHVKPRQLQYLIWLWERAATNDMPQDNEVNIFKIDITVAMEQKKSAVDAHISQTTCLIDDDPEGFILSPEILNHFNKPFEIFVEFIN